MQTIQRFFTNAHAKRAVLIALVVICVLLPFSTPLTVLLGSHLNHLSLFKIWKEIAMVAIVALVVLSGTYRRLAHIREPLFKLLAWLIVAYAAWLVLLGMVELTVFGGVTWEAFLYASIVNLRFVFFFLLCWLVAQESPVLGANWRKILLVPAAVVVSFGLLQHFVLPATILTHVGYGPDTIAAYQTVDQKPDFVRVQSTLRGPNPLGAYLIVIIAAVCVGWWKRRWLQAALLAGSGIVLFYSYSRSAWLGVAVALGLLIFLAIQNARLRRYLLLAGTLGLVLCAGFIYIHRDNPTIQTAIFHTDPTSLSPESSNEQRAGALQRGLTDVANEPYGRGPGSAGPASLRNEGHPGRLAENYYLQIGQELGWIGLALFLLINGLVAFLLWQRRQHPLAKVLLASLAGITLVNLLSHAWTDETLALLWWGLAGIALAIARPFRTKA